MPSAELALGLLIILSEFFALWMSTPLLDSSAQGESYSDTDEARPECIQLFVILQGFKQEPAPKLEAM